MADKPTNIFQDIASGKPASIQPRHYIAAREWFRQAAAKITNLNPADVLKQLEKSLVSGLNISGVGSMYLYRYNPKTKDKLPYYDTWPLIFLVKTIPGGHSGLNLHYLSPALRAKLMNSLYGITIKDKGSDRMKVQLSYDILNSASRLSLFKPCYKRYLTGHIRSRMMFIDPSNWDQALMLPLARFVKQPEEVVWAESMKRI